MKTKLSLKNIFNFSVTYPQAILSERLYSKNKNKSKSLMNCDCLPVCTDLVYDGEITTGQWDFNNLDEAELDNQRELMNQ